MYEQVFLKFINENLSITPVQFVASKLQSHIGMLSFRRKLKSLEFIFYLTIAFLILHKFLHSHRGFQLQNILEWNITSSKNIFFIKVSFDDAENSMALLKSREACSIESAALANPNARVYMIFADKTAIEQAHVTKALRQYQNIFMLRVNVEEFSAGTFTESWIQSKKIYNTKFIGNNVSNFLRFLLLWRFAKIQNDEGFSILSFQVRRSLFRFRCDYSNIIEGY